MKREEAPVMMPEKQHCRAPALAWEDSSLRGHVGSLDTSTASQRSGSSLGWPSISWHLLSASPKDLHAHDRYSAGAASVITSVLRRGNEKRWNGRVWFLSMKLSNCVFMCCFMRHGITAIGLIWHMINMTQHTTPFVIGCMPTFSPTLHLKGSIQRYVLNLPSTCRFKLL